MLSIDREDMFLLFIYLQFFLTYKILNYLLTKNINCWSFLTILVNTKKTLDQRTGLTS